MPNEILWFERASWDAPNLRSPQPCVHGAGCVFTVKDNGKVVPGCCRYVHPGEEGTGRRFFPARQIKEVGPEASFRTQPACVRLTGAQSTYYERMRRKMSWQDWCKEKGIQFTPNKPGELHKPVTRVPFPSAKYLYKPLEESKRVRSDYMGMSYTELTYGKVCSDELLDALERGDYNRLGYSEPLPEFTPPPRIDLSPDEGQSSQGSQANEKVLHLTPLRIRGHRRRDEDEGTGLTPEALEKTDENIDYESVD